MTKIWVCSQKEKGLNIGKTINNIAKLKLYMEQATRRTLCLLKTCETNCPEISIIEKGTGSFISQI